MKLCHPPSIFPASLKSNMSPSARLCTSVAPLRRLGHPSIRCASTKRPASAKPAASKRKSFVGGGSRTNAASDAGQAAGMGIGPGTGASGSASIPVLPRPLSHLLYPSPLSGQEQSSEGSGWVDKCVRLDDRLMKLWMQHPHLNRHVRRSVGLSLFLTFLILLSCSIVYTRSPKIE